MVEPGLNDLIYTYNTKSEPKILIMMYKVVLLHFTYVSRKHGVVKTSNTVHKKCVILRRESVKLTYDACSCTGYLERCLSKFGHSWRGRVIVLTKCKGTWDNTICCRYGEEDVCETHE